jgi:hypothetical protein
MTDNKADVAITINGVEIDVTGYVVEGDWPPVAPILVPITATGGITIKKPAAHE